MFLVPGVEDAVTEGCFEQETARHLSVPWSKKFSLLSKLGIKYIMFLKRS